MQEKHNNFIFVITASYEYKDGQGKALLGAG
jgi:hypothetical protein